MVGSASIATPRSSVILAVTARSRTSSELLADLVADARLVKAANTLSAAVLASDPHEAGGQRVILISGDDTDAKRTLSCCSRKRASPRSTRVRGLRNVRREAGNRTRSLAVRAIE
jgi:hypothetical protein